MSSAKFTSKTATNTLVKYAADNLGLDLSDKSRDEVIAQMTLADASLFSKGDSQGETAPSASDTNDTAGALTDEKGAQLAAMEAEYTDTTPLERVFDSVTLVIHDDSGQDEETDNFVQVGLNGVMYQVMKGREVTVPAGVYHVLNDAVESNYKTVTDPSTKLKSLKETKVKRWPFSVVSFHYNH